MTDVLGATLDACRAAFQVAALVPDAAAVLVVVGAALPTIGWLAACVRHQRHRRALTHALHRAQRDAVDWRRASIHAVAGHAGRDADRDADRGRAR